MDLTDNNTFQVVFIICLAISLSGMCLILFFLKKKGVEIHSSKVILTVSLSVLPIAFFPGWLHPQLSVGFKFALTFFSVAVAFQLVSALAY